MTKLSNLVAETRKAIGVGSVAVGAWITAVVQSDSGPITKGEWVALVPIVLAILACYGLTNESRS